MLRIFSCLTLLLVVSASPSVAGVPETISYQGVLTDGSGSFVPDGNYDLDFAIYIVSVGGTPEWTESHASVPVSLGTFHVILGSTNPLSIPFDKPYWLGITVNSGTELAPRVELTSVAYSLETKAICLPYEDSGENGSGSLVKLSNTSSSSGATGLFVDLPNGTGTFATAVLARTVHGGSGGYGVRAYVEGPGSNGIAVYGQAVSGRGVVGNSTDFEGVDGSSSNGTGVRGSSVTGTGVYGFTASSDNLARGVYGNISSNTPGLSAAGVYGNISADTTNGFGVWGQHGGKGSGVYGLCNEGKGVRGHSDNGIGVQGTSPNGLAGDFQGNVNVTGDVDISGNLTKTTGTFKIDHPLDPENRFLSHSFVESPDMMNIYNGNATLGATGEAWVDMPDYFEALNRDFRYQLTPIGAPAPGLYIAEEIRDRRFRIAGGSPGLTVSWQVTGIRQDAAADYYRVVVETEKSADERGRYLNPEAFGLPAEKGIHWAGSQVPGSEAELANAVEEGR